MVPGTTTCGARCRSCSRARRATRGPSSGPSEGGFVYVAHQFDSGWRARAGASPTAVGPQRAFGWAMGFPTGAGGSAAGGGSAGAARVTVMHDRDLIGTVELWGLAILWLAALWITRKPGSS